MDFLDQLPATIPIDATVEVLLPEVQGWRPGLSRCISLIVQLSFMHRL